MKNTSKSMEEEWAQAKEAIISSILNLFAEGILDAHAVTMALDAAYNHGSAVAYREATRRDKNHEQSL